MSSRWQSSEVLCFVFSITVSGDSASYFLEINITLVNVYVGLPVAT